MDELEFYDLLDEAFDAVPTFGQQQPNAMGTTPPPQQPPIGTEPPKIDPRSENLRKAYEASLTDAQKLEQDAARSQDVNKYNAAANARKKADDQYKAYQATLTNGTGSQPTQGMPQNAAF